MLVYQLQFGERTYLSTYQSELTKHLLQTISSSVCLLLTYYLAWHKNLGIRLTCLLFWAMSESSFVALTHLSVVLGPRSGSSVSDVSIVADLEQYRTLEFTSLGIFYYFTVGPKTSKTYHCIAIQCFTSESQLPRLE